MMEGDDAFDRGEAKGLHQGNVGMLRNRKDMAIDRL